MLLKGFYFFHLFYVLLVLVTQVYSLKSHGNPAKDIVNIINNNRTSMNLPTLYDNPGLGCMALQYAEECKDNCTSNNSVTCKPLDDDFTEIFAPDCGVELPTFTDISGHIVGCWSKYLEPTQAFSEVLFRDNNSLKFLKNKTHTEMGVGVVSTRKGQFLWCVLFSNAQARSSFVLENRGAGIKQKNGCYSGNNITCNEGNVKKGALYVAVFWSFFLFWFL